jgi:hypothetical protein
VVTRRVPTLDGGDKVRTSQLPLGTTGSSVMAGNDVRVAGVQAFGAVGDNTADDTAAIQAAIAALPAAGGTVRLPAGTYKLTDAITLRSNLTLIGDSDGGTVIRQSINNKNALTGVAVNRVTLENLWLSGPGTGTGDGINITKGGNAASPFLTLRNITADAFRDGVSVENGIVSVFDRVIGHQCTRYGINLYGQTAGAAGTSVALNACYGDLCTTAGIRIYNMAYTSLHGCAADHNPVGYLIDSCQSVALTGCGAESNTTAGFRITGGFGNTLTSPWVFDNKGIGIHVTGSAGTATVIGATDNTPGVGASNFIKVDAGSRTALLHCNNTTANSLATGTTNVVADAAGGAQAVGYTALLGGGEIDADLTCWDAAKGFVLVDRSNSNRYRLKMTAGVLGVEVVP